MKSKPDPQFIKDVNKNVFNEIASLYDTNRFFEISARHLVDQFINLSSGTLLDVAAGTGAICTKIAQKYPGLNITAVDQSIGMLREAKKKMEQGGSANIRFICQDVETVRFQANSFNFITCGYGMLCFPEMEKTFS